MFTRIGDILPRCRVYQALFPSHGRLLQAISVVYLDIIYFCTDAKITFRKLKSSKLSKPFHASLGPFVNLIPGRVLFEAYMEKF